MPTEPGKVLAAIEAVRAVGLSRREDLHRALHAVLADRRDRQNVFDQAVHVFGRHPSILVRMMGLLPGDLKPAASGRREQVAEPTRFAPGRPMTPGRDGGQRTGPKSTPP
jgi:uncharacterized protein with von Willebrand factor type A (vWA) domain